jgi:hypothetical protein
MSKLAIIPFAVVVLLFLLGERQFHAQEPAGIQPPHADDSIPGSLLGFFPVYEFSDTSYGLVIPFPDDFECYHWLHEK